MNMKIRVKCSMCQGSGVVWSMGEEKTCWICKGDGWLEGNVKHTIFTDCTEEVSDENSGCRH